MEMEYKSGDTGGEPDSAVRQEEFVGVYLRYIPNGYEEAKEICIPVYSPERDEGRRTVSGAIAIRAVSSCTPTGRNGKKWR